MFVNFPALNFLERKAQIPEFKFSSHVFHGKTRRQKNSVSLCHQVCLAILEINYMFNIYVISQF